VSGGAESHIQSLRRELDKRGYEVDIVKLPFKWYPVRQILNDALAWRLLDLTNSYGLPVDLVIATRFPSYAVRHPRKIAWVLHQHRQAYDLLNTELTDFKDTVDDDQTRKTLYELDTNALKECKTVFANSKNVAERMKKYLGIESAHLYHPPPLFGRYNHQQYNKSILSVGRLECNKRVDLLLKAVARIKENVSAIIVGKGPQENQLKELACSLGIADQVKFAGFVSDEELINLYGNCGVVYYGPIDEDYGYVTLEAFLSEKTVITANDSGGVLEFVDTKTGLVASPHPESIAKNIRRWLKMPDCGRSLALNGKKRIETINWDNVINQLTSVIKDELN